jgi:hypothetical protein
VPGGVILGGIQPIGIQGATLFLFRELLKAGYRLGRHDAEAGEAETHFFGHGVAGRIKVRAIVGCYGATQLVIRVAAAG